MNDTNSMKASIDEALKARENGEVPIGAVAVANDTIIAGAHNERELSKNPLGHAELLLIQKLTSINSHPSWRLDGVTIYVTCEPCIMCMGAMLQARIKRIVYGCKDPKAGACGSLYDLSCDKRLNHRIEVTSGVLGDECGKLLSEFFKKLRK